MKWQLMLFLGICIGTAIFYFWDNHTPRCKKCKKKMLQVGFYKDGYTHWKCLECEEKNKLK